MTSFGFFDLGSGEYVITTPITPRPQENVLFNERYFTIAHQTGNGFSRYTDPAGYATTIVAGTEEPAYNGNSRIIYVRDDDTGQYWNVGYYPVCRPFESYRCRQGAGYTVLRSVTDGISATWRLFVPPGLDPVEVWTLTIANLGRRRRRLSVFGLVELSLEMSFPTYGHASYLNSLYLNRANGLAARKVAMDMPNPYGAAVFLSARRPTSMDADMNAFVEQFRTLANPKAMEKGRCSGSIASRDRIAGVIHHRLSLKAGKTWRCDFLVGAADADKLEPQAARYTRKYLSDRGKSADAAFGTMRKAMKRLLGHVVVRTPDAKDNMLFNQWIPLLVQWGLTSGRWGMLGYRDIVQQACGALMFAGADKVRMRLQQAMGYQYQNGHAVRSFPQVHKDSRMRYSDSALWLIGSITEYIKEHGDIGFLDRRVPFLDGDDGTVIDHMRRAMDVLWQDRGEHGLCRMHEGDWNDSLTHVGRRGQGESVWLTQALCAACLTMAELHEYLGEAGKAGEYRKRHAAMKEALNSHCWDGAWYLCAFDDDGKAIGSRKNRQGRIFLNTQSWAMLSDTAEPQRIAPMLKSIRKHLWTPYGYMLHYPTFTRRQDNIGRLSCLEPGCSENASVYTHGNAFLAVALLRAGLADEGYETIRLAMPFNPRNPSESVIPYQLVNGYAGVDHRNDPGKAQFGWSTGSGGWLHRAMVEYAFGVRRTYRGLCLRPRLPSSWMTASVKRRYRGGDYVVNYVRHTPGGNTVSRLEVNGADYDFRQPLPCRKSGRFDVCVTLT